MKKILLKAFIVCLTLVSLMIGANAYALNADNYTDNIKLEIVEDNQNWLLNYTITHTFDSLSPNRHGIFYDISKNQDNVIYDYALTDNPTLDGNTVIYDNISELTSFRIRFGDKNQLVPAGTHIYKFGLKTKINKDYNHEFIPFYDWKDDLKSVNIIYQGKDICFNIDCINNPVIRLNPDKPKANPFLTMLQVLQYYFYAVLASILLWFGLLTNKFKDPYRTNFTTGIPYYASPNNMLPWDIESLINRGQMNVKDTLAAYILYLNHKNILKIIPHSDSKNVSIELLQSLPPNLLPDGYNTIINSMVGFGVKDGVEESKVLESSLKVSTEKDLLNKNGNYYTSLPELYPLSKSIGVTLGFGILGFILYFMLRTYILIGTSSFVFIAFCFLISMVILFLYLKHKDKLTAEGYEIFKEASGYKYYINKIEKEKLDFDNNPEDGAKFYLANVPYAAQFGELQKFNKYFQSLNFLQPQTITSTVILADTLSYSNFYVPPSSSDYGGGGSGSSGGFSGGGGSW